MSASDDVRTFERQLRELLARDADAVSGHVRSRLTQARHAALARADLGRGAWRQSLRRRRIWLPAAGVLAAAAAWVMIGMPHRSAPPQFAAGGAAVTAEDLTLLTDRDGLALVEGGGGQFYEWAAAQARSTRASGTADDEPDKNGG